MAVAYTREKYTRKILTPITSEIDAYLDRQRAEYMLRYGRYWSDASFTRAVLEGFAKSGIRVGDIPHPSRIVDMIVTVFTRPVVTTQEKA